ncbi:GvpL/GvpF family gas vesicle protein [Streptomyces sp. NPDC048172]|uniref:GvpL/GvpF family gas vesicle protein n=1 Tax=Streptomyces sp. NPDC048172 TaxID=3365505 RepID=UPI0037104512
MSGELRYVYAVTRPFDEPLPAALRGVDGTVPHTLLHDGLLAVLSLVPEADFAEEPLRAHLEDLDWLSGTARAHQDVVDALTRLTCPLPLRLGTVYRDDEGVRRMLADGQERFQRTLDRLEGRVEWGVKVYVERPAEPEPEPSAAPVSGRDYLRRRRNEVTARESALEDAERLADALHAALAREAEDVRLHRAQNPKLSGAPGRNLLNAAYLVPGARSEAFLELLDRLAAPEPDVRVEVTGPWAPYSFAAESPDVPVDAPADAPEDGEAPSSDVPERA